MKLPFVLLSCFSVSSIILFHLLIEKHQTSFNLQDSLDTFALPLQAQARPKTVQKHVIRSKFPCFPPEANWTNHKVQQTSAHTGLLYVKIPKAASTSCASVQLRIARNIGRQYNYSSCRVRFHHAHASRLDYAHRNRSESFLWSMVRDPTARAISQFFHFSVSQMKQKIAPVTIQRHFGRCKYFYKRWLAVDDRDYASIERILASYDFLGVTERFDESMVVLQMILGLTTSEILSIPAKKSGGYDAASCFDIQATHITPDLLHFLQSAAWMETVKWDEVFYKAVDKKLNETIMTFDRQLFTQNLRRYRDAQIHASTKCNAKLSCTKNATNNDCIRGDMGCFMECLDNVAASLGYNSYL